jgi:hypothetical protein
MRFGLHALPTRAAVCIASGDMKDHGALEPALAMSIDGASGALDVFDLTRRANAQRVQVREAMRTVVVCGVVRDGKKGVVSGAQILASPGDGESRTDSTGSFLLIIHTDASSVILTARTLGHTPGFRTVVVAGGTSIRWSPASAPRRAVALGACGDGEGVPAQLSSWRYDELMARRAAGWGFFMSGQRNIELEFHRRRAHASTRPAREDEVQQHHRVGADFPMHPERISERFIAPDALIGVWVNGIECTVSQPAKAVPGDLLVAEVIALEVYNEASEIPAEFIGTNYCGVVSVWTK